MRVIFVVFIFVFFGLSVGAQNKVGKKQVLKTEEVKKASKANIDFKKTPEHRSLEWPPMPASNKKNKPSNGSFSSSSVKRKDVKVAISHERQQQKSESKTSVNQSDVNQDVFQKHRVSDREIQKGKQLQGQKRNTKK